MNNRYVDLCERCGREFELEPGEVSEGVCWVCFHIERRERQARRWKEEDE